MRIALEPSIHLLHPPPPDPHPSLFCYVFSCSFCYTMYLNLSLWPSHSFFFVGLLKSQVFFFFSFLPLSFTHFIHHPPILLPLLLSLHPPPSFLPHPVPCCSSYHTAIYSMVDSMADSIVDSMVDCIGDSMAGSTV